MGTSFLEVRLMDLATRQHPGRRISRSSTSPPQTYQPARPPPAAISATQEISFAKLADRTGLGTHGCFPIASLGTGEQTFSLDSYRQSLGFGIHIWMAEGRRPFALQHYL